MPTELFGYLVEEEWMSMAAKIFGGILMVIPGVLLTILGVKCFWNKVKVSKAVIFGSIALWFVALFAIIGISVSTASKFRNSVEMTQEKSYVIPSDTLQVYFRENNDLILKSLLDTNINMNISIFYEKPPNPSEIKTSKKIFQINIKYLFFPQVHHRICYNRAFSFKSMRKSRLLN